MDERELTIHFSDGDVYTLPRAYVANNYVEHHKNSWHNEDTDDELYRQCYEDNVLCLEWFHELSTDDWLPHATFLYKVGVGREITHIDIG